MGMRGRRRLGEAGWRALLGRFAGSGLGVAAFCHREGVSAASFHRWRRRSRAGSTASGLARRGMSVPPGPVGRTSVLAPTSTPASCCAWLKPRRACRSSICKVEPGQRGRVATLQPQARRNSGLASGSRHVDRAPAVTGSPDLLKQLRASAAPARSSRHSRRRNGAAGRPPRAR
jgi:hypothetical protein